MRQSSSEHYQKRCLWRMEVMMQYPNLTRHFIKFPAWVWHGSVTLLQANLSNIFLGHLCIASIFSKVFLWDAFVRKCAGNKHGNFDYCMSNCCTIDVIPRPKPEPTTHTHKHDEQTLEPVVSQIKRMKSEHVHSNATFRFVWPVDFAKPWLFFAITCHR